MDEFEFRQHLQIEFTVLESFIAEGWLVPLQLDDRPAFTDADLARARLILDLRDQMGVNEAGIDIVMELIDQLHGLRSRMGTLLDSLNGREMRPERRSARAIIDLE
nr:chaperone modulator CbpM [uncultured Gellertiella sp.]